MEQGFDARPWLPRITRSAFCDVATSRATQTQTCDWVSRQMLSGERLGSDDHDAPGDQDSRQPRPARAECDRSHNEEAANQKAVNDLLLTPSHRVSLRSTSGSRTPIANLGKGCSIREAQRDRAQGLSPRTISKIIGPMPSSCKWKPSRLFDLASRKGEQVVSSLPVYHEVE